MEWQELGYPLRESGGQVFLYLTATVVKRRAQTDQETHMRPPDGKWRLAHVLIDKNSGELVIWCEKLSFWFRAIIEKQEKKPDIIEIECRSKKNGTPIILDAKSRDIVLCIESQVAGLLRRYEPIIHKNKKK